MSKPPARSVLYRLIEAGQLARRALLVPLRDRGLEAGDDAMVLLLRKPASAAELRAATGLGNQAMVGRLDRLVAKGFIRRETAPPNTDFALTEEGERLRIAIETSWDDLENKVLGGLPQRQRKRFARTLKRIVSLLRG